MAGNNRNTQKSGSNGKGGKNNYWKWKKFGHFKKKKSENNNNNNTLKSSKLGKRKNRNDDEESDTEDEKFASKRPKFNPKEEEEEEEENSKRKKLVISLQYASLDSFAVTIKPKNKESGVISILQRFPGFAFNKEVESWCFPLSSKESFLKFVETNIKEDKKVENIPKEVTKLITEIKKTKQKSSNEFVFDVCDLPENLSRSLLPFQMNGVMFAQKNNGKCIICDEMGLGKTIQAIAIAACYSSEWPVLIIVPSSVKHQWAKELQKWIEQIKQNLTQDVISKVTIDNGINIVTNSQSPIDSLVNIISYNLVPKIYDILLKKNFQVIIADESHYLKNSDSQRSKALIPILKNAKRRILLTGTPVLNRPSELYTQLDTIDKPIFPSFKKFGIRYCDGFRGRFGWDFSGNSNLIELHLILQETVMIRRLKQNVMNQLPPKKRFQVPITPSKIASEFDDASIDISQLIKESKGDSSKLMELYTQTGLSKIPGILEYISPIIEKDDKFLIFAHHKEVLNAIEDFVKQKNRDYIRIDGTTSSKLRSEYVSYFQTREHCRVAILSLTAAGTGLSLQSASVVVFGEIHWTPGILLQAEDRVHRIGQTKEVHIHYLLGKGTLDDRIWPLIARKIEVLGKTLDADEEELQYQIHKKKKKKYPQLELQARKSEESSTGTEEDLDHSFPEYQTSKKKPLAISLVSDVEIVDLEKEKKCIQSTVQSTSNKIMEKKEKAAFKSKNKKQETTEQVKERTKQNSVQEKPTERKPQSTHPFLLAFSKLQQEKTQKPIPLKEETIGDLFLSNKNNVKKSNENSEVIVLSDSD